MFCFQELTRNVILTCTGLEGWWAVVYPARLKVTLSQPDEELGLFIFYRFKCVS